MAAATVKDVARLAHVSPTTVSNFVHYPERLSARTFEDVRRAIRELDYRPNAAARSLRATRRDADTGGPDAGRPTLRDVAKAAHLTYQTVSKALNHPEAVRPKTLTRVSIAVQELGFLPNRDARAMRRGVAATGTPRQSAQRPVAGVQLPRRGK